MSLTRECPGCGKIIEWSSDNPYRPFCSGRCKDADFIGWAEEKNVIKGEGENADFPLDPED